MKTVIDGRGVVSTNPEEANTFTIAGNSTFQGPTTFENSTVFQGAVNFSSSLSSVAVATNIYVNGLSGNDSNAGTSTSPVASIEKALSLLPIGNASQRRIYFASGTYTLSDRTTLYFPQIGVGLTNEPVVFIGGFDTILTGTVASADATAYTITKSGSAMPYDVYAGKTLKMISGADSGSFYIIGNNGPSLIKLGGYPFYNTTPSPGDTFAILQPNVTINYGSNLTVFESVVGFSAIKFYSSTAFSFFEIRNSSTAYFEACEIAQPSNGNFNVSYNSFLGGDLLSYLNSTLVFNVNAGYVGLFINQGNTNIGYGSNAAAQCTVRSVNFITYNNCNATFYGFDARASLITVKNNSKLGLYANTFVSQSTGDGIVVDLQSQLEGGESGLTLQIKNSSGNGIVVKNNSIATLIGTTGTGNTARGLVVSKNSSATVTDANTGTTISGSTGAVLVGGNSTPTTWALISAGGINAVSDFSASVPQFCRIYTS